MQKQFIILFFLIFSSFAWARSDSLDAGIRPKKYKKRDHAVFNVALVYYGSFWNESDMQRIAPLLKERFEASTNGKIELNIAHTGALPYKHQISDYPDYRSGNITDPERLQRVWYYDNVGGKIITEVYDEFKKSPLGEHYKQLDALLIVSGAQYDALGFASGRVAITEQPREIAWGLADGGRTEIVSDENLVDELIHELGHTLFLGHTSTQCQKPELTLAQSKACCDNSASKNDVMSYCRDRRKVDENFFYGFEACTQSMIEKLIVPAMLNGKNWNVSGRLNCL